MSANNWRVCPNCKRETEAKRERMKAAIEQAYGEATADSFLQLVAEYNKPVDEKETFREDYEIGVHREEFFIDYLGECEVCGFQVAFNHTKSVFG